MTQHHRTRCSALFGSAHGAFSFSCRYSQDLPEQPAQELPVRGPAAPALPRGDGGTAGMEGQGRGEGRAFAGGATCSVTGAAQERTWRLGIEGVWEAQCHGVGKGEAAAVEGRDEEGEGGTRVGLMGPCTCCCLNIVLCRRDTVPAGWWC